MRYYKQHHAILKMLYDQFLIFDKENSNQCVALDFKDICKNLNCELRDLHLITAKLFDNEEVQLYKVNTVEGLFIKPKGITAYADKKYLKDRNYHNFDQLKNWVQVSIPVLSLLLAIAIYLKSEAKTKEQQQELQAIKLQVRQLQDSQKLIQRSLKKYPDSIGLKNDSLSIIEVK